MATPGASTLLLTTTERVHMGRRTAEALREEAELLDARRIFLLVSSSLRNETQEISLIEEALKGRIAAVHDGIPPHAPRSAVLAAAAVATPEKSSRSPSSTTCASTTTSSPITSTSMPTAIP